MKKDLKVLMVIRSNDGFADGNDDFIEVDGVKYVKGDDGKAKVGDDGKPIPFTEKSPDDDEGGKKGDDDMSNKSLEDLAKVNPHVARMLKAKQEADAKLSEFDKAEEDRKRKDAEAKGEWQKLADEEKAKRELAETENKKKSDLLGKYINSTKTILENVLKTIPDDKKALIPDNYSPREKLEYIIKNQALLGAKVAGGKGDKVDPNDVKPNLSEEETLVAEIEELQKKQNRTATENTLMWEKSKKLKELRNARMQGGQK